MFCMASVLSLVEGGSHAEHRLPRLTGVRSHERTAAGKLSAKPRRPLPIHRVSRLLGASLPAAERTDADRDRDYRDRDRDLDRELDRDPSYERSRAKISFTRPGFALPRVSFMTCPTKYPRSAVLPAR